MTDAEMIDYLHSQLTPATTSGTVPMRDEDVALYTISRDVWDALEAHIGKMEWKAQKEREFYHD